MGQGVSWQWWICVWGKQMTKTALLAFTLLLTGVSTAMADIKSKVIREAAEHLLLLACVLILKTRMFSFFPGNPGDSDWGNVGLSISLNRRCNRLPTQPQRVKSPFGLRPARKGVRSMSLGRYPGGWARLLARPV